MRGRRPIPAAQKQAMGNPGKRPIVDLPNIGPDDAYVLLTPPEYLDETALEVWKRLGPNLRSTKLLRATDVNAFGRYCYYVSAWLKAAKAFQNATMVTVTKSKHVKMERLTKWLDAVILLEKKVVDLEDRLGLSPAARQRVAGAAASSDENAPGDGKPKSAVGILGSVH